MTRPVRSPDIGELRAFCLAADLGSLGRAARVLHVSQPALSKRLRVLEALAGTRLLDRSPRGVTLTTSGGQLYREARKLLAQVEAVESLLTGLSAHEFPVKLAASHTVAEFVLPGLLVQFEGEHERHLSVELVISNSSIARDAVRSGSAEVGLIASNPPGSPAADELIEIPFSDDEIVVAVPPGHPWADLDEVPRDQLLETPLILRDPGANSRRTVESVLAQEGLSLAGPLAEMGSTNAVTQTALAENVPAMLSRIAAERHSSGLVVRSVEGLRFPRHFVMVLATNEESLPTSVRTLVRYLIEHGAG